MRIRKQPSFGFLVRSAWFPSFGPRYPRMLPLAGPCHWQWVRPAVPWAESSPVRSWSFPLKRREPMGRHRDRMGRSATGGALLALLLVVSGGGGGGNPPDGERVYAARSGAC